MMILVSGSTKTMRRIGNRPGLGVLFTPASRNNPSSADGRPWACDNSAFTNFNPDAYEFMLDRLHAQRRKGCLFVTVPDVVGDSTKTLALFREWLPRLLRYRFPLAFVAQDGQRAIDVPWRFIRCLFIGGTTAFKLSSHVRTLAAYAKALGKTVHVGRVNSDQRLRQFQHLADTVDGTKYSMFGDTYIERDLDYIAWLKAQARFGW